MDNEASTAFNMTMISMKIKYQLVPPSNHIANNVERLIQTFKNHFIAGLYSIYKYFNLQLWYRLLQQAIIIINLLRQPGTLPQLSAYTRIFREFNFNRTPLDPPGTRVIFHNRPNNRTPWAPNGEYGYYIGPSMEQYS